MSIGKRGGYTGGRPASEMGPPAQLASATIQRRERRDLLGAAEWLSDRADSYGRDAEALRSLASARGVDFGADVAMLQTLRDELRTCVRDLRANMKETA